MNADVFKGKFKEWTGALKSKWGEITDDEWQQIDGNKDRLVGIIQQKYGRTKEDAEREFDDFFDYQQRKVS